MPGFGIDQTRITTKCNQCDGIAIANFEEKLWVCEYGHTFSIMWGEGSGIINSTKEIINDE